MSVIEGCNRQWQSLCPGGGATTRRRSEALALGRGENSSSQVPCPAAFGKRARSHIYRRRAHAVRNLTFTKPPRVWTVRVAQESSGSQLAGSRGRVANDGLIGASDTRKERRG